MTGMLCAERGVPMNPATWPAWPRCLSEFDRPPGRIKTSCEDFVVEEIPLYPADGVGTHTFFLVEKRGLSTMQAVADIARALGVPRRSIGYAGLKDARALTRQWMSVEHVDPLRLTQLQLPHLRILETARHGNKLRLGHLRANRFTILVRGFPPERFADVRHALEELCRRGVPNYFGRQRFGSRGDTWEVGRAIVAGRPDEAIDLLLGRPDATESPRLRRARQLYQERRYAEAASAWPAMFQHERRALRTLARGRPPSQALAAIDPAVRRLYVSAFQSYLFNQVVARRLPLGLDRLLDGDLAWVHRSGAVFRVVDARVEQPRADAFEISPSGPLFGYRMTEPLGEPAAIEGQVLATQLLTRSAFRSGRLRVKGGRRPLRFQPAETQAELGADQRGPYLALRFVLPSGCYATALLRELLAEEPPGGGES